MAATKFTEAEREKLFAQLEAPFNPALPTPEKLALYGVTLQQLEAKIQGANRSFLAGQLRDSGRMMQAVAGQTLSGVPDIGLLLVTTRDGRPVYVRDLERSLSGPVRRNIMSGR